MSEKQQASLLLVQGEKGSLAMKVDALKEENDTLRAKNKNLLHNQQRTGDAHKAEQDAEIALLRKEREGFQADLQASRLQSSVALQRLKDKSDEYELSLQEVMMHASGAEYALIFFRSSMPTCRCVYRWAF